MKVWITKYALTTGIFTAEGTATHEPSMIEVKARGVGCFTGYYHDNDWHTDEASAIQRAHAMRVKKIASLRKSISKLQDLEFAPLTEKPVLA